MPEPANAVPATNTLVDRLLKAQTDRQAIPRLTLERPITEAEAYDLQWRLISRLVQQGNRVVGKKTGLTSEAKQRQMHTNEPLYGYILDSSVLTDGQTVSMSHFIHPRVECEIAFIMGKPLLGPDTSGEQVLRATSAVLPALEIIDSRYQDFKFELPDVIADNASAAQLVLGSKRTPPPGLDLPRIGMKFIVNGAVLAMGQGAAVMGDPAEAVAWLVRKMYQMAARGLDEGDIVMSGGLAEAYTLAAGDHVLAEFDGLGTVGFKCV